MRKIVLTLTLLVCLALAASAAFAAQSDAVYLAASTNDTVVVSNSTDVPDAHLVHPAVYKIDGANCFRLRDVAMLLRGSAKQFTVDYDAAAKTVSITTGKSYTPVGGELSGAAAQDSSAIITNDTILVDGDRVTVRVFKIDGANYFGLRDLGKALDFHVDYNDDTKTVFISGAKGYEE